MMPFIGFHFQNDYQANCLLVCNFKNTELRDMIRSLSVFIREKKQNEWVRERER